MGLKMKYVVPRSVLHSLRRAIQATNRIASSDDSTFHSSTAQSSLLSSQPSVIDSSQTSVSLPPPLQQSPSTRQEELMKLTRDALADLCRRYGIRVSGKKPDLVSRILQVEQAVKQGLSFRESSTKLPSAPSSPPISKKPLASPSIIDDDESLLHQLRREEFQKQNRGKDYFFDPSGRYNISVDDVSTFLSSANGANSTVFSPSVLRVAEPPSQDLSISRGETSIVGDLPRFSASRRKLIRRRQSVAQSLTLAGMLRSGADVSRVDATIDGSRSPS